MADIEDLYVRPGDPILPAWQRLREWAEGNRIELNGELFELDETPHGSTATFIGGSSWEHPFGVSISGLTARIDPGFVNGEIPMLGGIRLDGVNGDGEPGDLPSQDLITGGGADGRSFIGIEITVDPQTGEPRDRAEDWLEIVHRKTLPILTVEGGSPDEGGIGFHPLAILYWNGSALRDYRQHSFHNITHRFVPEGSGEPDRPGRHFFLPS